MNDSPEPAGVLMGEPSTAEYMQAVRVAAEEDEFLESSPMRTSANTVPETAAAPPTAEQQQEKAVSECAPGAALPGRLIQVTMGPQHFSLLRMIGEGAFGKVLMVQNKLDGNLYAMKVISKKVTDSHTRTHDGVACQNAVDLAPPSLQSKGLVPWTAKQ
jgi:hypothetical protein